MGPCFEPPGDKQQFGLGGMQSTPGQTYPRPPPAQAPLHSFSPLGHVWFPSRSRLKPLPPRPGRVGSPDFGTSGKNARGHMLMACRLGLGGQPPLPGVLLGNSSVWVESPGVGGAGAVESKTELLRACRVGLGLHPQGEAPRNVSEASGTFNDPHVLDLQTRSSPRRVAQCLPCAQHGAGCQVPGARGIEQTDQTCGQGGTARVVDNKAGYCLHNLKIVT